MLIPILSIKYNKIHLEILPYHVYRARKGVNITKKARVKVVA